MDNQHHTSAAGQQRREATLAAGPVDVVVGGMILCRSMLKSVFLQIEIHTFR